MLSPLFPVNKQLWSPSYVGVSAGVAGLALALAYAIVDCAPPAARSRRTRVARAVLAPLAWVGMNAIGVFVVAACGVGEALVGGVYVGGGARAPAGEGAPRSLLPWLERRVFVEPLGGAGATRTDGDALAHLLAVLAKIAFWIAACGLAHRRRWYWKI